MSWSYGLNGPSHDIICAGDDPKVLEREIAVIKELLEEQPDSKCTDGIIL
jgi:hypothetical protein